MTSSRLGAETPAPLHRRDLVGQVVDAFGRGALLITAPAGYGKTTLVESALAERGHHAAWVRCTPAERDPGRLVTALVAAIRRAVPGAAESVAEAMVGTTQAVDPIVALRALEGELDRLLVEHLCIVLDDAENLAGASESCEVVAELVRSAGARFGVAVVSRGSLGLRLAKRRWAGRVVELTAADLTFDLAECAECIRQLTGREPSSDEAHRLVLATEGWPFAVATILVSGGWPVQAEGWLPKQIRSPRQLKAFMIEEVVDPLDQSTREQLLVSAVPLLLSPASAEALGLSARFMARLHEWGLYCRVIDGPRNVISYHPLFRELLLERLATELGKHRVAALHRAVAPAVAHDGDATAAIEHWIAAEAWTEAVDAIAAEARALVVSSPALMGTWLDRLPAHMRDTPTVRLIEGHLSWVAGRYPEAIHSLQAALPDGDESRDAENEWWCRFLLIDCLNMSGRAEEAARLGDGFDRPEAQAAGVIATATGLYAAHTLAAMGRTEAAEEIAARSRQLPAKEVTAPIDSVLCAYIDLPAGRLDAALQRATRAFELVEVSDPLLLRFNVMATIATVLSEQGRLGDALAWWERQRAEAEASLMTARSRVVQGLQAQLLAQLGHVREAEAQLATHRPTGTWADIPAHVARCLTASARGDWGAALSASSAGLTSAETAPPLYQYWAMIGMAPALARVGRVDRGAKLVAAASELVRTTFPGPKGRFLRARTLVLEAWLAAEEGAEDEAATLLQLGFVEGGDAMPHLLRVEWDHIEPVLSGAVASEDLDASTVVGWLWEAFPDGRGLAKLIDHPRRAIRRASFKPALCSGHPQARVVVQAACEDDDPEVAAAARRALERVATDPPPRQFSTLGGFGVRVGGWQVNARDWARPVDARLLRFLLVLGHEPVAVDVLLDTFWPDLTPERARRSLQVSASRVRAILDHPRSETTIEVVDGYYRLHLLDRDTVDWREFELAAMTALAGEKLDRRSLERAHSLWGGEPLPRERYSDWARGWRDRMRKLYSQLLGVLVSVYDAEGDFLRAIRAGRELVELDPLNEAAHRSLMSLLARAGRRGEALRQFLACRQALTNELGVEPDARTADLQARILAGVEA